MYIVVVGGGMVGFHLTRALFNAGHEVFVVDTDAKRVEELIEHFGNVAIKCTAAISAIGPNDPSCGAIEI